MVLIRWRWLEQQRGVLSTGGPWAYARRIPMSRAGARGPPTPPITKNSSTFSLLFTSNTQYVVITFNQFHYLAELPEKQLAYMFLLKYQVENSYHIYIYDL